MERPWNNPFFPLTQYPTILTILKKDNFCFSLPSSACLPREFLAFPANVPLENLYLLAPNSISFLFQGPNKERDKLSFATSYDHWRDLGRGIDLGPRREKRAARRESLKVDMLYSILGKRGTKVSRK